MRTVVDAPRMQRGIPRLDVVLTEEIAVVVEEELVVIGIAMEERDPQGFGILFERAGQETAHHGAFGEKSRMGAGWEVGAVAHNRPNIPHVDFPDSQIALPADHVNGVERVDYLRDLALPLDADLPLAIVIQVWGGLWGNDHAGIVQRVVADQALVGLVELGPRLDDQEEIVLRLRKQPVSYGARKDDVVSGLEGQRAEVGLNSPLAAVHEQKLVAVGVPIVKRHRLRAPRNIQPDVVIPEEGHGHAFGIVAIGRRELVEAEKMRAELAF